MDPYNKVVQEALKKHLAQKERDSIISSNSSEDESSVSTF